MCIYVTLMMLRYPIYSVRVTGSPFLSRVRQLLLNPLEKNNTVLCEGPRSMFSPPLIVTLALKVSLIAYERALEEEEDLLEKLQRGDFEAVRERLDDLLATYRGRDQAMLEQLALQHPLYLHYTEAWVTLRNISLGVDALEREKDWSSR